MPQRPRPVVYVVIDGMSTDAFEQVTASGRAPALAFLRGHGHYVRDSVAMFPTITPAATASLITGEVPARHGVPGMCWYDRAAQRFVNYGQSARAAVVEGVRQVVRDFTLNLNCHHLSPHVRTLHESLHEIGLTSASINFMVFRGPYSHKVKPNVLERLLLRRHLADELPGPKEHYFADIISGPSKACGRLLSARGVEKRVRATDAWAACVTRELLEKRACDVILFYLHENDHHSHDVGPSGQVDSLAYADRHIAHALDAFGSWDRALREAGWVVTADHSQSPVGNDDEHVFDLGDILQGFEQLSPGRGKEPFGDNDVACAGNGRAGFIYLNEARKGSLHEPVVEALLQAPGIDQVMWREGDSYHVVGDRGRLNFQEAEGDGVVDERGNKWTLAGDRKVVSAVVEENTVRTPEYPLAMWRIKSALDLDRTGDIVVTTKLTYEISDLAGAHHRGGGDHASLHAQDSTVPFLSTLDGPPLHPSTIDVVPHILAHFQRPA